MTSKFGRRMCLAVLASLVAGAWFGMQVERSSHRPLTPFWKEDPGLIDGVCQLRVEGRLYGDIPIQRYHH